MIFIDPLRRTQRTTRLQPKHVASKKNQDVFDITDPQENTPSEPLPSPTTISLSPSILGIQSTIDDPLQQSLDHGHAMLDELEKVRLRLMDGTLSKADLTRLESMLNRSITPPHRDVELILDDIKLRISIELAKLGV